MRRFGMRAFVLALPLVATLAALPHASAQDRFGFPELRPDRSVRYRAHTTDASGTRTERIVLVRFGPGTPTVAGTTRIVRFELLEASGAAFVPRAPIESLPITAYVNRRGLRVEERGRVFLPPSFGRLPTTVDLFVPGDRVVAQRAAGDLGCLAFGHTNAGTHVRESWRACFDASGTLRSWLVESGAGRFELSGPIATPDDLVGAWFSGPGEDDGDTTYEATLHRESDGRIVGRHVTSSAASVECDVVGRASDTDVVADVRCLNHYVSDDDPEITEGACRVSLESGELDFASVTGEDECPIGGPTLARTE